MRQAVLSAVKSLDRCVSRTYLSLAREKNSLITVLIHGLFNDADEIALNHVDPQQAITTGVLRHFIEYYLKHGYLFISPQDILAGLENDKSYVLITFDDGYYNNHLALPVLQEYRVPAVFFISSDHITQNKCFWWDVVYRERSRAGAGIEAIRNETATLKGKTSADIEQYVTDTFGNAALRPISDIDRPFTPSELNAFSKEALVFLGNHTSSHAILTNCPPAEIRSEIAGAQEAIFTHTGIEPIIVSYPNGNVPSGVMPILRDCGLKLGVRVVELKNYLPIDLEGNDAFLLNRFVLWGTEDVARQCTAFRSDLHLLGAIKRCLQERRSENRVSY